MNELLPCPFCGGEAHVFESLDNRHHNDGNWDVECRECDLSQKYHYSMESAIQAWNERTAVIIPAATGTLMLEALYEHYARIDKQTEQWRVGSKIYKEIEEKLEKIQEVIEWVEKHKKS